MDEKQKKIKTIKTILIIFLVISVAINIWSFFTIIRVDTDWQNEYNNLDTEWCELSNEYVDAINSMLIELEYYDPYYGEINLLNETDCWG